jgi:hypothetical protein
MRSSVLFIAAGLTVALLLFPLATIPLAALAMLGFILIQSAVTYRNEGWVSGFVFGVFLLLVGICGFIGAWIVALASSPGS